MADQPRSAALSATGDGLDPVAGTARWIAAMRALQPGRPDRLFDDPLAATLAGEPGRALQEQLGEGPNVAIAAGFDQRQVTLLSTAGTLLGRWPHPDFPRGTPGVPHAYLVLAHTTGPTWPSQP